MADTGYGCEFGDCTDQPNHLLTTISPPATVSLCDEHYPAGLIPLLAAELGVDPGDFYSNVERYLKRESARADKAIAQAQAAEQAKGSDPAGPGEGHETFHEEGRDLRAARKHEDSDDDTEPAA